MIKNWPYIAVVALLALVLPVLPLHADNEKALKALMKRKLEDSQKVLEGLATNDFDKVAKHADDLIQVSKDVEWRVMKTREYEMYSNDFRRNAETLVRMAKAKNTDGIALAYVDLTLNCVKCHKHVREERRARLDVDDTH
jgi:hypothetical protein